MRVSSRWRVCGQAAGLAVNSSAIRAACANERSCGSLRGATSNGRPYRDTWQKNGLRSEISAGPSCRHCVSLVKACAGYSFTRLLPLLWWRFGERIDRAHEVSPPHRAGIPLWGGLPLCLTACRGAGQIHPGGHSRMVTTARRHPGLFFDLVPKSPATPARQIAVHDCCQAV